MLDKNDLQAIAELIAASEERMSKKIAESEERMGEKIAASEERMKAYVDEKVTDGINRSIAYTDLVRAEVVASEERMSKKIVASEERMGEKIAASEERMKAYVDEKVTDETNRSIAYTESVVEPKLDAIKEALDLALETHIPVERIERIEENIIALKSVVRKHSEEIELLKRAQ